MGATFGEKLKRWRETRGETQMQLAVVLGVSLSQVSKWERDDDTPRLPNRAVVDLVLVMAGGPGYLLRVPAAMTVG